ncbi:MAG: hypothetical protein JWR24_593 [Actinoallomurus sp.]|jgi:hypothetical protein|nr:hypothetical protein [Actinoallomurus sp.]
MRRHVCDHPVEVDIRDDRPSRFRRGECEYEVVTFLKMLAFLRPQDDVDTQLWQIRARSEGTPERTYELQCDHGEWRMTATWS